MKKLILTSFFIIGITLASCILDRCPPVAPYFKITGLSTTNLKYINDQQRQLVEANDRDTIKWDYYFNKIIFEAEYIASTKPYDYNFGNSLYALSCVGPGYKGSKTGVKRLYIITLNNYDSLHTQNDTLNDIIRLNYWSQNISDSLNGFSIDTYIKENNQSIRQQYFEIHLTTPPKEPSQFTQFKIIYELNNGEIFDAMTKGIYLQK